MATDRPARDQRVRDMSKRAPVGRIERLETRDLMAFVVGPVVATEEQAFQGQVAQFAAGDVAGGISNSTITAINWGDGTITTGTISGTPQAGFAVSGSKSYLQPGRYQVSVTITNPGLPPTVTTAQGDAQVTPAPLAPVPVPFTAFAGRPVAATLATFQDLGGQATDYAATVQWGEGEATTSANVVVGSNGILSVVGAYTYPDAASGPKVATVSLIRVLTGQSATVQSPGTVAPRVVTPLPGSGVVIVATARQPFSGTIATFTNPDGSLDTNPGLFTASIGWGDGSTSPGIVGFDAQAKVFTVTGSHAYAAAGTYPVDLTVVRRSTGEAYGLTTGATVAAAPVTPVVPTVGTGLPILATVGQPFTGTVATFTTQGGATVGPNLFSASIRWGDGTTSAGTVGFDPSIGAFTITGSHTYTAANTYPVGVTVVRKTNGQAFDITTTATVAAFDSVVTPLVGTGLPILATARQPFSGPVATFGNPDGSGSKDPGQYSATIGWGDGTTSAGNVGYDAKANTFFVSGSHTYAAANTYTVSVTVVSRTSGRAYGLTTTATVSAFEGAIDPLDSPGADGITRINTPRFSGKAEPLALVRLFARKLGDTASVPLGVTITGSNGQWALAAPKLPDGSYLITGVVSPPTGSPFPETQVGTVVIDTVRPEVVSVRYNRRTGEVTATVRDDRSGFDPARLSDPASYSLAGSNKVRVGAIRVRTLPAPAGSLPTDPTTVVVSFRLPPRARRGVPVLRIAPGSFTDRAGNALGRSLFKPDSGR